MGHSSISLSARHPRQPALGAFLAVLCVASTALGKSVANLNASTGLVITQIDMGSSTLFGGDINGDGLSDLIIAAPMDGEVDGNTSPGSVHVVFGSTKSRKEFSLSSPKPPLAQAFSLRGLAAFDNFGSAASVGDVNGDGFDDILIGASGVNYYSGAAYLIFGRSSFSSIPDMAHLHASEGFVLSAATPMQYLGSSACLIDLNGDGFSDVVLGAPGSTVGGKANRGLVYVLYGKASGWASASVAAFSRSEGFTIAGSAAGSELGGSMIRSVGDLNRDGLADLAMAETLAAPRAKAYVLLGTLSRTSSVDLSAASLLASSVVAITCPTSASAAAEFGFSLGAAGDVNGDGFDDLVIGSYGHRASGVAIGAAYIIFGRETWAHLDMDKFAAQDGVAIAGEVEGQTSFGYATTGVGDVNHDGIDDLAVSAPATGFSYDGGVYLLMGSRDWPSTFGVTNRAGPQATGTGEMLLGQPGDVLLGMSVEQIGDFNGDGLSDLAVSSSAGRVYIAFGSPPGKHPPPSGSPTSQPSTSPSPSHRPSVAPSWPSSESPTEQPSAAPSPSPTEQAVGSVSMRSVIALHGLLDTAAASLSAMDQEVIVRAKAAVLHMRADRVAFVGEQRNGSALLVSTSSELRLEDFPAYQSSTDQLFAAMDGLLESSVETQSFALALREAASERNVTTFRNATVAAIESCATYGTQSTSGSGSSAPPLLLAVIVAVAITALFLVAVVGCVARRRCVRPRKRFNLQPISLRAAALGDRGPAEPGQPVVPLPPDDIV